MLCRNAGVCKHPRVLIHAQRTLLRGIWRNFFPVGPSTSTARHGECERKARDGLLTVSLTCRASI